MDTSLYPHQQKALLMMHNGCVLNGDVGSGKSRTSLAYFYTQNGGRVNTSSYVKMVDPPDLYIITIAKKRDNCEWEEELLNFMMTTHRDTSIYDQTVVVDSWQNIKKYDEIKNAFFIFDEAKVGGYGSWTKSFLKITKNNKWILLSATPGDKWEDYLGLFIANGYFKNKTDFINRHCIMSRYTNFPKIEKYINEPILMKYKRNILVNMDDLRQTIEHHINVTVGYDVATYEFVSKNRWNIFKNEPIENASQYCATMRKIVCTHRTRQEALIDILTKHPKAVVFYNYDYELDIIKQVLEKNNYPYKQWNGHKHDNLPTGDKWCYLVEYLAGAEGWNCITTDTMIFYSENYSYRIMKQASGRINRMNTKFIDLYYYHFRSTSNIDMSIYKAIQRKKKFNEKQYCEKMFPREED